MKLTFIYYPVTELEPAVAFHRDVLGLDEAWREGDDTVAFSLPGDSVQIMVSVDTAPPGPMYLVDDVDEWLVRHPDIGEIEPRLQIPGGSVARLAGLGDNTLYIFDQTDE